ncbi:hypothetical protein BURCENBC7_AP1874 [Burkholderia cenocepacia BC7]|nr:uncharacterized protein BCN122_II2559 [Burkholderia cenocepacia]EPZ90039.1 hypothetical protein BURCENK562V_C4351 [Burkholderia cenocepacia K56-2Valvano]ERI32345.1 hypothetical protein BURCENBC7_AP1874 [Burkholderia cenocepacia BC7]CDN63922.1 hypothetical protein I35_6086 [Burkholderia cenocepacia H111]
MHGLSVDMPNRPRSRPRATRDTPASRSRKGFESGRMM